jgi:hypothetical protein
MANGVDGVIQIALSAFFGSLASVGQLLSSAKILTKRRIIASMVGGITGGISAGFVFALSFPDLIQNYLLASGAGALGGVVGVHAILAYFLAKHAPKILAQEAEADTTTVQKLIDSGEFTQAEIQSLIDAARKRREKAAEKKAKNL